ncbi:hypothetical protein [Baaleninema simplex]|nr:hypothetical protein [Baaleninema simplex]
MSDWGKPVFEIRISEEMAAIALSHQTRFSEKTPAWEGEVG